MVRRILFFRVKQERLVMTLQCKAMMRRFKSEERFSLPAAEGWLGA